MTPAFSSDTQGTFVARLRRNDEAAYEELVRTQAGRMLSVARRLLRNDEDARDAVQQALLAAFRAIGDFNGECQLATWLHRIVVNVALMKLRSRARRPEESIEDLLPHFLPDGHHVTTFDRPPDAETLLLRGEARARVRAAIDQLPDSYRTVILLRDIDELDTEEAAQLLGLTPNAVKIRLHRARQALVTLLAPGPRDASRPAGRTAVRAAGVSMPRN